MLRNFVKRWAILQASWVFPSGILALVLDEAVLSGMATIGGSVLVVLLMALILPERWW